MPQLDGLRGIAILLVFLCHAFDTPLLWSGVDLFFVLSGYLITQNLLRLKEKTVSTGASFRTTFWQPFFLRRARRILPPYFLFLLTIGSFFSIPWPRVWYWFAFFGADFEVAKTGLALLPLVPLWSLAVEEQFYLIWPWIVRLASRRTLKMIALGVIIASPVLRAVSTPLFHTYWPVYALPFFRADTLAWGAFIAVSEYQTPSWIFRRHRLAGLSACAAGALLIALSAFRSFRRSANLVPFSAWGYTLVGIVCAGALIYALGARRGFALRVLKARALGYLGRISYTFYLYHLGVLLLIHKNVHARGIAAAIAFAIALAIASLSWKLIESPLLTSRIPRKEPVSAGRPATRAKAAGAG